MNQLEQLKKYLGKLNIPFETYHFNKDKFLRMVTNVTIPSIDDRGYSAKISATDSITVRKEKYGIKEWVVATLYYIEAWDGFVDPNDCHSNTKAPVMDAWESARYIGGEYFEKDPEEIEPMLESKKSKTLKHTNENAVREYTTRIQSLIDNEFISYADIGEYMLMAFSEDQIEKAYGWMEQDEMIPSEDELRENGVDLQDSGTRLYTNRIIDLVNMEYLTYEQIGDYLLTAFSEDDIEKLYGWLEQDEKIPTEDDLKEDGLCFDTEGELTSADEEPEESLKKKESTGKREQECSMLRKKMECKAQESVYSKKGFPKQDGVYDLTIRDRVNDEIKHIQAEWSSYLIDWKGYVVDSSIEVLDYKFLHE